MLNKLKKKIDLECFKLAHTRETSETLPDQIVFDIYHLLLMIDCSKGHPRKIRS